jgi:hypothetical protein
MKKIGINRTHTSHTDRRSAEQQREPFPARAICIHDDDEELKPVERRAIISVNGRDVERCRLRPERPKRAA